MAECLTNLIIPATHFKCIYVANNDIKNEVETIYRRFNIACPPPYVNIQAMRFEIN